MNLFKRSNGVLFRSTKLVEHAIDEDDSVEGF